MRRSSPFAGSIGIGGDPGGLDGAERRKLGLEIRGLDIEQQVPNIDTRGRCEGTTGKVARPSRCIIPALPSLTIRFPLARLLLEEAPLSRGSRLLSGVNGGLHSALLPIRGLDRPGIITVEPAEDGWRNGALDLGAREEGRGTDASGSGGEGSRRRTRGAEGGTADEMPFDQLVGSSMVQVGSQ